jgi:NAD(P)-dependent dehydrogenase (short-subunit alcohol dehydrogenase family)
MDRHMEIPNSIAFVTGANRGLGRELVTRLLELGATKVYAGARDLDSVEAGWVADPRVQLVQVDVTDESSVQAAAAIAADITLLINNAGTLRFGTALEGDLSEFRSDLETNLFGTLNVTRAFAAQLKAPQASAVVNLSSIIALAPARGMVGYSISKAAVHSFTQGLRAELHGTNTEVIGVYPAQIDTDMLKGVEVDKAAADEVAERILQGVQAGDQDIYPEDSSTYLAGVYTSAPAQLEAIFSGTPA